MCVQEIVRRAAQQAPDPDGVRRTRCVVVRNTMKDLKDTTIKTLLDWLPDGKAGYYVRNDGIYYLGCTERNKPGLLRLSDGTYVECEIHFKGLDRPDQQSSLLSYEPTFAWINEFREIDYEIFSALVSRLGRFPGKGRTTWRGVWMDSNMFDTSSKWYKLFNEEPDAKLVEEMARIGQKLEKPSIFRQPGGLDPMAENIENLPGATPENPEGGRAYYYNLLATNPDQNWINMHVHAQYGFIIDGMGVYENQYNDKIHCPGIHIEVDQTRPIAVGMDFGLTPAAVFGQLSSNGQWRILGELVTTNTDIQTFCGKVRQYVQERGWPNSLFVYGDPAGNQRSVIDKRSVFDVLRAQGFKAWPAETQDPTMRIDSVRAPLNRMVNGEPAFVLDVTCHWLRRGFLGGYHYRRKKVSGEHYDPKPDKNEYSHVHDALQYLISQFESSGLRGGAIRPFPTMGRVTSGFQQANALDGVSAWA